MPIYAVCVILFPGMLVSVQVVSEHLWCPALVPWTRGIFESSSCLSLCFLTSPTMTPSLSVLSGDGASWLNQPRLHIILVGNKEANENTMCLELYFCQRNESSRNVK
jgi:hypothetical protein